MTCGGKAAARSSRRDVTPSFVSLARRGVVVWMRAAEMVAAAGIKILALSIERWGDLVSRSEDTGVFGSIHS